MSNVVPGAYSLNASSNWVRINTFKEGLLSRMGHDLLLEVRHFSVTCEIKENGEHTIQIELAKDHFEVIEPATMSSKDRAEIQRNITKIFPANPTMQGKLSFDSDSSGTIRGEMAVGKGSAPVVVSFDLHEKQAEGKVELSHQALHIKPFRAPLGVIRLQDRVVLSFSIKLSTLFEEPDA